MGIDESGRRCVPRPQFTPRLGDGVVVIVVVYVDCGVVDFMLDAVIVFNWSFAEVLGRCFFFVFFGSARLSSCLSMYFLFLELFAVASSVCFYRHFLRHLLPLLASRGAVSNRVNKWPRPRCCDWCCAVLVGWLAQTTDSD